MALTPIQILALSRSYTDETVEGAGAIKGAPCEIESIVPITGGNRITFSWTDNAGKTYTDTLDVMDGAKGDKGNQGDPGVPGQNGTDGKDGDDGYSPTIVVKTFTDKEYVLTITDATGSYDTPNLRGASTGVVGSYSEENLSLS